MKIPARNAILVTILSGVAGLLLLTAILIVMALIYTVQLNQRIEQVVTQHNLKAGLISTMYRAIQNRRNVVMSMLTQTDIFAQDEAYLRTRELATELVAASIKLEPLLVVADGEWDMYKKYSAIAVTARSHLEQSLDWVMAGDILAAKQIILEQWVPANNQVLDGLIQLHELQRIAIHRALDSAKHESRQGGWFITLFGISIMLLNSLIGWIMARYIAQQAELLTTANTQLENRVTERTAELVHARDDALRANQMKSQFLAKVSHELRTPLNAIIGYSELLQEECQRLTGTDNYQQDLAKIEASGRHLLTLINDILDLAKIDAGKIELHQDRVVLADLLRDVSTLAQPLVKKNANLFRTENRVTLPAIITDAVRIRQILFNLISNASKFTDHGTITLTLEQDRQWVYFLVQDTGIGMDTLQVRNLFQEFVQGNHDRGGTGLGLTISLRLCTLLGGSIQVESRAQQGSLFKVRLPLEVRDNLPKPTA